MAIPSDFEGTHWGVFDSFMHIYLDLKRSAKDPNQYEGTMVLLQGSEYGRRSPVKATVVNGSVLVLTRTLHGQDATVDFGNFHVLKLGGSSYSVSAPQDGYSIHVLR